MSARGLAVSLALAFAASPAAGAPAPERPAIEGPATGPRMPHMKVELVGESAAPERGGEYWAGVLFEPDEGWHIYWKNPGDSGTAPTLRWRLPEGALAGAIRWPAPQRLPIPPLMDFGYVGPTLLAAPISGLGGLKPGEAIEVRADWLVCAEVCVPGRAELKLTLPARAPRPQEFARTRALWPAPARGAPFALADRGAELALALPRELAEAPEFFPAEADVVDNVAPQKLAAGEGGPVLLLKKSDQLTGSLATLSGVLRYGPASARKAVELQARAVGGAGEVSWAGVLQALLFAWLGGLILNLMPCVFPVLSIKVLAFVSQKEHERGTQRRHALLYAAGILVSFWALTAILLVLRSAGEKIGWGFQLQSPGFVAVLGALLFFLGLSLVGVFEIGGSLMGVGHGLVRGEGNLSSFFTGVLATVVATPCTAPLMGSAVGFALAQPLPVVFGVFTALAAGLALPYVLLAWFPAVASWLPRPGRWMETFKQLMAFPVFGTVIWLVWVYGLQTGMLGVLKLLGALLLVALGAWLQGRFPSRRSAAAAALLAALGLWGALTREAASRWEPYTAARLAELRARHAPAFVDFTAAWCVSCKVNELVALSPASVAAAFERKHVRLLKGDWTSSDPQITAALAQFGRSGVPFYVLYYTVDGVERVVTLPEVLTPQIVLDALEPIPNEEAKP